MECEMNINRQNVDTYIGNIIYTKKGNLGNRTKPESTFLEGKNFNCAASNVRSRWIEFIF